MRFDGIKIHNMGTFGDVDLDLGALPGIVAVVGENGAGKSTLLELLAGGVTRECPTRGPLSGLARGRDSWVETRCASGGEAYTIRHTVDALSGKGESLVVGADGVPCIPDTKVRSFDAWASSHLPAPEVLYAAQFGVQGDAGFLALKPSARKAVLLRLLGVERFERYAATSGELRRGALVAADRIQAQIGEIQGDTVEHATDLLEACRTRLAEAQLRASDAGLRVTATRQAAAALRAEEARVAELHGQIVQRNLARRDIEKRIETRTTEQTDLLARLANNRRVLEEADEIRAAAARREKLLAEVAASTAAADAAQIEHQRARNDVARVNASATAAEAQLDAAIARRGVAVRRVASFREARAAAARAPELRASSEAIGNRLAQIESELAAARAYQAAGVDARIDPLLLALRAIASGISSAPSIAQETLDKDADHVARMEALPGRIADLEASRRTHLAELSRVERDLASAVAAGKHVAAQGDLDSAVADAEREVESVSALLAAARAEVASICDKLAASHARLEEGRRAHETLLAELRPLQGVESRCQRLLAAEGRIEELLPQVDAAAAEVAKLWAELGSMGPREPEERPRIDVEYGESQEREAHAQHAHAAAGVAGAESRVGEAERHHAAATASADRREQLRAELAVQQELVADYAHLQADFGREGIQAFEIDAAGPELSALATDLLHTCVGPRWTVCVDTQRLGADGRLLESLEVRVLDTEAGREGPVETFSGGERVLIGEAVSLALTMLACRSSGQRDVTIVRDESGAALDGAKARAYVEMLRRAVAHIGARQVLLVSHSPDVAELCDARLVVSEGKVTVQ